jgi:hypothetical protein
MQKEVGGEGVSRIREVGGLVGRSAVGGLGKVGASQKKLGIRGGPKEK